MLRNILNFITGKAVQESNIAPATYHSRYPDIKNITTHSLKTSLEHAHQAFLNLYMQFPFQEEKAQKTINKALNGIALNIYNALEYEAMPTIDTREYANLLAHEMQQRAKRQYQELYKIIEKVLIDQRNHILAEYINETAKANGMGAYFSGVNTELGSPCQAFAYKLLADSSLGRGNAAGLSRNTILNLQQELRNKAESDIIKFVQVYNKEQAI